VEVKEVSLGKSGGKELKVKVRELTVKQIRSLLVKLSELGDVAKTPLELLDEFKTEILPMGCTLKPEDFEERTPSELKGIWDAFREVNTLFFGILKGAGLVGPLSGVIQGGSTSSRPSTKARSTS
jgi:hypothetical protein